MSWQAFKRTCAATAGAGLMALCLASSAAASFGIAAVDGSTTAGPEGGSFTQAGGHPYAISTTIELNSHVTNESIPSPKDSPDADVKDIFADLPPGLMANPTPLPQCSTEQLEDLQTLGLGEFRPDCPVSTQVGVIYLDDGGYWMPMSLYNMTPPAGVAARFGFNFAGVMIVLDGTARGAGGAFHLAVDSHDISQGLPLVGVRVVFWGTPADPRHDRDRCSLGALSELFKAITNKSVQEPGLCEGEPGESSGPHSSTAPQVPFLTLPTSCTAAGSGLRYDFSADGWTEPGVFDDASFTTHEAAPNQAIQRGVENCEAVSSNPEIQIQPTVQSAETPSGLNVQLSVPTDGLLNPTGVAQSQLKKVEVTLPEGVTINPSQADGLGACSPQQYEAETVSSAPGQGCPSTSKIGTVTVATPLLPEPLLGALYVAKQGDNPFDSLLALYFVAKDSQAGIIIKAAGEISLDPATGQITATFDNLPQAAFSTFTLSFRGGQRSPLATPPACGIYTAVARFTPYAAPDQVITRTSSFEITQGVDGGPCPSGATPFHPSVVAGSLNNVAGGYSPFDLQIERSDGEQEITRFSTVLPPGLSGNLSGIPFCSDAAIEAARSRTGTEELEAPSCPMASEIGHTVVAVGVGTVLAQTPGKIYLAGPYHGSALSIVSITSATVGPFDLGTVVIRFALRINPTTAQVEVDSTGSDPIPHIIDGIVVHVREIHVYIDRSKFTLNPTSCNPMSIFDTLVGAGNDLANPSGQTTVGLATPYQSSDCSRLGFKPAFKVSTSGRTSRLRGASLTVKVTYPTGSLGAQANIAKVKVELPKQLPSRLSTLQKACPDATFNQNPAACPVASQVGRAVAVTPIVPVPLSGPAYFVSHGGAKFPELVVVLSGYGITVDMHGETFISKAGITSSTFGAVPDVPINTFELTLPQGPDSALAAIGNLCTKKLKMPTSLVAQNGSVIQQVTPVVTTGCPKHKAKKARGRNGKNRHRK